MFKKLLEMLKIVDKVRDDINDYEKNFGSYTAGYRHYW